MLCLCFEVYPVIYHGVIPYTITRPASQKNSEDISTHSFVHSTRAVSEVQSKLPVSSQKPPITSPPIVIVHLHTVTIVVVHLK